MCLANRIRIRILDTRMDEWMAAFLINWQFAIHRDIECFRQITSVFFCIAHRSDTCGILSHMGVNLRRILRSSTAQCEHCAGCEMRVL